MAERGSAGAGGGGYVLRLSGVGHSYYRDGKVTRAVTDIAIDVHHGEFVAIVGRSGSGKSTLLRLMGGLMAPTEGVVAGLSRQERSLGRVGMMFQSPVLAPWLTIRGNLLLLESLRGSGRAARRRALYRAGELLERVGLSGSGDSYPFELSGGMQQRAALARALMLEPTLMLLDEPFGALDALTRAEMNMELQTVWMAAGCSIVLVTHDIAEAVLLADRVLVMSTHPGRVVASYDIALGRPRLPETRFASDFLEDVHKVLKVLESTDQA